MRFLALSLGLLHMQLQIAAEFVGSQHKSIRDICVQEISLRSWILKLSGVSLRLTGMCAATEYAAWLQAADYMGMQVWLVSS